MENPLKIRRLQANYTIDKLARAAGVTHDNIIRNEQGLFNKPSPRVLSAVMKISGDSAEKIVLEYVNWIGWKRRQSRKLFKKIITFGPVENMTEHPFLQWRKAIAPTTSRIEFCKMLAVHPSVLLKYESGKQRSMPEQISEALRDCGLSNDWVVELAQIGAAYFDHKRYFKRYGQRTEHKNSNSQAVGTD